MKDQHLDKATLIEKLIANTPMIFYIIDKNRVFRLSEGLGLSMIGLEPGQVVGMSVKDIYSQDQLMLEALNKAFDGELQVMNSRVGEIHFESYLIPYYDKDDAVEGIIGVGIDVSRRDMAEQDLYELNKTLEDKVEQRTMELSTANEQLMAMNEELNAMNQELTAMNEEVQAINLQLSENNQAMVEMQAHMVETEKMASLGALVAGVAHEVNTPIGVSITAATHLSDISKEIIGQQEKGDIDQEDFKYFLEDLVRASSMIERNLNRAGDLVQSFKQLSVDQSVEVKRTFDVGKYINETIISLSPTYKHLHIDTTVHCERDIIMNGWPGAMAQIMTNLYFNAIQHGFDEKAGGHIHIDIEQDQDHVVIKFGDDGNGMEHGALSKIFDPFYTTKRQSGGTGLGMSVVYTLVTQKFKGKITCSSTIGEGTEFLIILPVGGSLNE